MTDPIFNVHWMHVDKLQANSYNPNVVFSPELRLLERSILSQGWIQPIIANPDGVIIDGFHRWMLSRESKAIRKKYDAMVPVVSLNVSRPDAMMMTIRINRAKGSHGAIPMSKIVQELIDEHGVSMDDVGKGIGANRDEVELLYQGGVFKARNIKAWKYSQAWYPREG